MSPPVPTLHKTSLTNNQESESEGYHDEGEGGLRGVECKEVEGGRDVREGVLEGDVLHGGEACSIVAHVDSVDDPNGDFPYKNGNYEEKYVLFHTSGAYLYF